MSEDMNVNALLELAAKAAGYPWRGFSANGQPLLNTDVSKPDPWLYVPYVWNPLTDDGDALRLAVKLHMFDAGLFMAFRFEETRKDPSKDDYEITRRAIVRAAAKIGKGME
jgi:hypothetical protein